MAGSLTEYALRLSQDPQELITFRSSSKAARAAMAAAGLSAHEQSAMLDGDPYRLGMALGADAGERAQAVIEQKPGQPLGPMESPPGAPLGPMERPPDAPIGPMERPPGGPPAGFAR